MLSKMARKVIEFIDPGPVRARGQMEITPQGQVRAAGDLQAADNRLEGGIEYDLNKNGTHND